MPTKCITELNNNLRKELFKMGRKATKLFLKDLPLISKKQLNRETK